MSWAPTDATRGTLSLAVTEAGDPAAASGTDRAAVVRLGLSGDVVVLPGKGGEACDPAPAAATPTRTIDCAVTVPAGGSTGLEVDLQVAAPVDATVTLLSAPDLVEQDRAQLELAPGLWLPLAPESWAPAGDGTGTLTLGLVQSGPWTARDVEIAVDLAGAALPDGADLGAACAITGPRIACTYGTLPGGGVTLALPVTLTGNGGAATVTVRMGGTEVTSGQIDLPA